MKITNCKAMRINEYTPFGKPFQWVLLAECRVQSGKQQRRTVIAKQAKLKQFWDIENMFKIIELIQLELAIIIWYLNIFEVCMRYAGGDI